MRITQFTDYSLRVLLYLGLKNDRATIREITEAFRISNNHLMKVVHQLSRDGYINSYKGKNGGIALAVDPTQVRIGDFINSFEPMDLLECFNAETNTCPIRGVCHLEHSLYDARKAFLQSLNRYTLADYLTASPTKTERMKRLGIAG
jgi:Rrf2 family nitric oxide-sensitive transcriptional repressor